MRRKLSARVERVGVASTQLAVEDLLGWLFREQPTGDYGIDAQVEVVDGDEVRGKLIALQIKSGTTWFRERSVGGWWFRPRPEHVDYWRNHCLPVVVSLYHPTLRKIYWQLVTDQTLVRTRGSNWKMLIPETNVLDESASQSLREAAEGQPVTLNVRASQYELGIESGCFSITPSAQMLLALAGIIDEPWMCIAEIIDVAREKWRANGQVGQLGVEISLINWQSEDDDQPLTLIDDGPGMGIGDLLDSVQGLADTADANGLSMLLLPLMQGSWATVRTSRAGDPTWREIRFDRNSLLRTGVLTVQLYHVAKNEAEAHGTMIEIHGLNNERWRSPTLQQSLVDRLGDCYSSILGKELGLIIDRRKVFPRRACIWSGGRSVTRFGKKIAAVQRIECDLPSGWRCISCNFRGVASVDICVRCKNDQLTVEEKHVWGWLGIQRYVHPFDYGIDFFWRGRKVLFRDKSLFVWSDRSDPTPIPEYPVDLPMGGRIVGEIHCDHLAVNPTKSAFYYESVEWKQMVIAVRGISPLGPQNAARRGYSRNDSPLGILFHGFRRNDPGLNYLIPGNGTHAVHEITREWGKLFMQGKPEYQADELWYQAALAHDQIRQAKPHTRDWRR